MQRKVVYVREHYSKEVRLSLLESVQSRKTESNDNEKREEKLLQGWKLNRKKQRVWTLNRSPHGNKTAREQFGRQVWQRRRERNSGLNEVTGKSGLETRKKVIYGENQHVTRKERKEETR